MSEPAVPTVRGALGRDHGYGPDIDHVLLSEEQIQEKIGELADAGRRRLRRHARCCWSASSRARCCS